VNKERFCRSSQTLLAFFRNSLGNTVEISVGHVGWNRTGRPPGVTISGADQQPKVVAMMISYFGHWQCCLAFPSAIFASFWCLARCDCVAGRGGRA